MPRLPESFGFADPQRPIEWAPFHAAQGWAVFPLAPNAKEPYEGSRGVKDASRDPEVIERWIQDYPDANLGGCTDGFLVIDVDTRSGGKRQLTWQTRWHDSGRGEGGHLIYRLTPEQKHMGLKSGNSRLGPGLDVKTGSGSYVVLPASIHPDTGKPYVSDRMPIRELPDKLARQILEAQQKVGNVEGATGRSLLSHLLNNPPPEGGRNEWLTKVAGHYAKLYRRQRDLYDTQVMIANQLLTPPLAVAEAKKTGDSIWNTETSGHPDRDFLEQVDAPNGYLASGDFEILHAVLDGPKEAVQVIAEDWANFDIRLVSELVDPRTHASTYDLRILRKSDRLEIPALVPASLFGDSSKLRSWLASLGLSVRETPERPVYKSIPWASRLNRYVRAQNAPTRELALRLGWDEEEQGFLTHTNAITAEGPQAYRKVQPTPALAESGECNYEYGFAGTEHDARDFLRRVLTFHDELSMAAFGSWWAANLIKQWVQPLAGMFPFMAIEAASESGKTEGAFGMLVRMSGNQDSSSMYTPAALRDAVSTNLNGITWVDDVDDPSWYFELIRALVTGGTHSKKAGETFQVTQRRRLVGSLLLSGEALGLDKQKALLERCVLVSPPSPTERTSLLPSRKGQAQYADVLELRRELTELGGEQQVSGHYLRMVAGWGDQVTSTYHALSAFRSRAQARDSVLRTGARVLDAMLAETTGDTKKAWSGQGTWARRLEQWFDEGDGTREGVFKGDNKLFLELLPWAISRYSFPDHAHRAGGGAAAWIAEPGALVDVRTIWFSPRQLSQAWSEYHHGKIDPRLDTERAIKNQARQAGVWGCVGNEKRLFRVSQARDNARTWYWAITGEMADEIIRRAEGAS